MNRQWVVGHDGSIYHYTYYNPDRDEMSGLVIYRPDQSAPGRSSATFAERVTWQRRLAGRVRLGPGLQVQPFDLDRLQQPDARAARAARLLQDRAAGRRHDDRRPAPQATSTSSASSGANVVPLRVDLHKKLAFPLVTFVMTLLAVPFGVSTGKRGTLYGIGLGIVIALCYWIVISAFVAVGKGGLLSPALAGWAPNILVASVASYLFLTART